MMVKYTKQTRFKGINFISASEIGQYIYCSVAWYLQKCGYGPESPFLEIGKEKHVKIGKIIYHTQVNTKRSRVFSVIGFLLIIIAVLVILYGAIS
jgi:CRISPR/Cas system-associated exonuclease Cas4 (RecB family)